MVLQKNYTKKLCKKITQKNLTHPDQSKKKHKIEVPFFTFSQVHKKNQKTKKIGNLRKNIFTQKIV